MAPGSMTHMARSISSWMVYQRPSYCGVGMSAASCGLIGQNGIDAFVSDRADMPTPQYDGCWMVYQRPSYCGVGMSAASCGLIGQNGIDAFVSYAAQNRATQMPT